MGFLDDITPNISTITNSYQHPSWATAGATIFGGAPAGAYQNAKEQDALAKSTAANNLRISNEQWAAANTGLLNPNSGANAADTAAAVSQANYNEWKNTYLPAALDLNNQTTYNNPGLVQQGVTQAIGNVNQAFDSAAAQRNRFMQQSGTTQDPMLGAVNSRVNNVQRSSSVVDAANRIRQNLADRNKSIMQSGIPVSNNQY